MLYPAVLFLEVVDHLLFGRNKDGIGCKSVLRVKIKPEALLNLFMTIVVHDSKMKVVFFGNAQVSGNSCLIHLVIVPLCLVGRLHKHEEPGLAVTLAVQNPLSVVVILEKNPTLTLPGPVSP